MATKADLEGRSDARLAGAVNKMLIARIAVGGLIVTLVKLF